jgi:ubiquinol-cytochrome c reductase cytochrome b subunit
MSRLLQWLDERLPVTATYKRHVGQYPAPKNFNFWYLFGALSLLVLVNQLLTGIWLTMSYVPTVEGAFASIEYIMRDVQYGWLLRYMHSTGASAFFFVIYLHMFRSLLYGSYQKPRELLWVFGMVIFLVLMTEAFMGYLLPWGQMSYWGAQVIISLFGAIPVIGDDLALWVRGDYVVSGATLNRFFALHATALPLILVVLVFLHLIALHEVGSNNPDGIEIKKYKDEDGWPLDGIPFHPYYTVKDLVGIAGFLLVFCYLIFFMPQGGGLLLEGANFEAADPLKTPDHITPVWYFTPFYAMLRAIPDKLGGMVVMAMAVGMLFVVPWLDRCKVKSVRYRSWWHKLNLLQFACCFIALGVIGLMQETMLLKVIARILTLGYFGFFVALWFYSKREPTKPVPERVTFR